jgi:hypothetical protein
MNPEISSKIHSTLWLGITLALGLIISTLIISNTVTRVKLANQTITVKGYAERRIKSDLIIWKGLFTVRGAKLTEAYALLNRDLSLVKEYLVSKGVRENDIIVSSIKTRTFYGRDEQGKPTDQIAGYELEQQVEIHSNDVDKISGIAREATELINKGVRFQSLEPQYFYTKLSDLKIEILAEATKDARIRAEQLAINSGCKVGKLCSAYMGVLQITKAYSTEVSDYGINDTSSLEKDVKAVVSVSFSID